MDVREMTPTKAKGAAGVPGLDPVAAAGTRLALEFYKAAQDKAKEEVAKGESMKGQLKKLMKLTPQEASAFCVTLGEKRDAIKKEAEDAGHKDLANYFKSGKNGGIAASIQSTVSLWIKMAMACAAGWKPNLDQPWAALSKEATDFKRTVAKSANEKPESDTERKAREAKEHAQLVMSTVASATSKLFEGEGDEKKLKPQAASALPDVVAGICDLATVEELDAVIARLQMMREYKIKAREEAGKAIAKAGTTSDKVTKEEKMATLERSSAPGNVGTPENLQERAHAMTRGDKPQAKGKGRNKAHA